MKLPTLTQLAREQARFVKYQDGKLWYQILTTVEAPELNCEAYPFQFNFPIPVDAPHDLAETVKDVIQALRYTSGLPIVHDAANGLEDALGECESKGAGGGEFLSSDKGLRFLRWITPQLKMLQDEQAKLNAIPDNVRHG